MGLPKPTMSTSSSKPNIINYYPKGEWKMTTKDRTKSFDSEINDYLILAQLLFFS